MCEHLGKHRKGMGLMRRKQPLKTKRQILTLQSAQETVQETVFSEWKTSSRGMTIILCGGHNLDRKPGQLHCPPTVIWIGTSEVDLRSTRNQQENQELTLQHSIALSREEIFLDKNVCDSSCNCWSPYELSQLNTNSFGPFLASLGFFFPFQLFFLLSERVKGSTPYADKEIHFSKMTYGEQRTKDLIAVNQSDNGM